MKGLSTQVWARLWDAEGGIVAIKGSYYQSQTVVSLLTKPIPDSQEALVMKSKQVSLPGNRAGQRRIENGPRRSTENDQHEHSQTCGVNSRTATLRMYAGLYVTHNPQPQREWRANPTSLLAPPYIAHGVYNQWQQTQQTCTTGSPALPLNPGPCRGCWSSFPKLSYNPHSTKEDVALELVEMILVTQVVLCPQSARKETHQSPKVYFMEVKSNKMP